MSIFKKRQIEKTLKKPAVLATVGGIFWLVATILICLVAFASNDFFNVDSQNHAKFLTGIIAILVIAILFVMCFILILISFLTALSRRHNALGNWSWISFLIAFIVIIISTALIAVAIIEAISQIKGLSVSTDTLGEVKKILKKLSSTLVISSVSAIIGEAIIIVGATTCYLSLRPKTK